MHLGFIKCGYKKAWCALLQYRPTPQRRQTSQWVDLQKKCISPSCNCHWYGPFRTVNLEKIDTTNEGDTNRNKQKNAERNYLLFRIKCQQKYVYWEWIRSNKQQQKGCTICVWKQNCSILGGFFFSLVWSLHRWYYKHTNKWQSTVSDGKKIIYTN